MNFHCRADDGRQSGEHPRCGAIGGRALYWAEEVSVCWAANLPPIGIKKAQLPSPAIESAPDIWQKEVMTCPCDGKAGGIIVGAIEHKVGTFQQLRAIQGIESK